VDVTVWIGPPKSQAVPAKLACVNAIQWWWHAIMLALLMFQQAWQKPETTPCAQTDWKGKLTNAWGLGGEVNAHSNEL
jgi:hypothetical protein